jgi:hypothetical protein
MWKFHAGVRSVRSESEASPALFAHLRSVADFTCKDARFIEGLDGNFPSEEGPPFIPV